jgi:hypothetical protein
LSAPNKSQQTQQQCLNQYNNSAFGKGTQFFSLYNFANNITSLKTWAEWTALPLLKVQAANLISKTAQGIGSTEFLSITSGTATTIVSPTAAGIGATESLGAVAAPIAIGAATVTDIQAHAACAGLYDNQQVMLAPTVFWSMKAAMTVFASTWISTIIDFLQKNSVLMALTASAAWFYAGRDYFRKGNMVGAVLLGGIAVLLLIAFCIKLALSASRSWLSIVAAAAAVFMEVWLMKTWLRQGDRWRI